MLGVAVLAAACGGSGDDDGGDGASGSDTTPTTEALDPVPGGQLVYATDSEVDGWHPGNASWPPRAHTVARAVFDPIAVITADGGWAPYLAESITPNDDYTVWTITLRPGITFHNGEPLDADALAGHLDAVVNGLVSSSAFVDVVDVRTVDDLNVEVEVAEPWSQFPSLLADQPGYVMAPAMIAAGGEGALAPIGTGPFVFDEWVRDDHIRLVRNDDYWQEGLPYLDSVEFRPLTDPNSVIASVEAGDVDAAVSIAGGVIERVPDLEESGEIDVVRDDTTSAEAVIMFNFDTELGSDPRVRRALAAAIDPSVIVDSVFAGQFAVATQPYEPDSPWYDEELAESPYDPETARALVEEYEAENGPLTVSILTVASSDFLAILQLVQQQLDEVGIDMEIESQEVVAFTQSFVTGDWDVILVGSFFRTADPDNDYHFLHSKSAADDLAIKLNFPRFRNEVVDEGLDTGRASDDQATRQEAYTQVWRTFREEVPYLFLYHIDTVALVRSGVHGLGPWTAPDGSEVTGVNGSAQWVTRAWKE